MNVGGLIVDVVEEVVVRGRVGRRFAWEANGRERGSGVGEEGPSKGEGDEGAALMVRLEGLGTSMASGDAVR